MRLLSFAYHYKRGNDTCFGLLYAYRPVQLFWSSRFPRAAAAVVRPQRPLHNQHLPGQ